MKEVFTQTAVDEGRVTLNHFEGSSSLAFLEVTSSRTLTLSFFLRRLTTSLFRAAWPRTFTLSWRGTAVSPTAGGFAAAIGALEVLPPVCFAPLPEVLRPVLPRGTVAG